MVDPTPESVAAYWKDISVFRDVKKKTTTLKVMAELFASFAPIWQPREEEGVSMYQHTRLDSFYGVLSLSWQISPGR